MSPDMVLGISNVDSLYSKAFIYFIFFVYILLYMKKRLERYPNNIRKYRERLGLSLKELALRMEIKNTSTVQNWEEGKCVPRSGLHLVLLLVIFNTTANKLYPDCMRKIRRDMNNRASVTRKNGELPLNDSVK